MDLALGLRTPAGEGRRFVLTVVTGRAYSSGRTTEPVGEGIRVREEAVRLHPDTHNRNIIYNHFQPNKNSKLMVGSARVFDGPKWSTTGWCARVASVHVDDVSSTGLAAFGCAGTETVVGSEQLTK